MEVITSLTSLVQDTLPERTPAGTYRFALNIENSSPGLGDRGKLSELGNRLATRLAGAYTGHIQLNRDEVFVTAEGGYLYIYNAQSETLTLLREFSCLNLNRDYPIRGESKVINGCERVVVWQDGVNPDRYYNIDKPDRFTTCDDLRLVLGVQPPAIEVVGLSGGGSLPHGAYRFVVEALDSAQNVLQRSLPSEEAFIGQSFNLPVDEAVGGAPSEFRSLILRLTNFSERASFARIYAIHYGTGDGISRRTYQLASTIPVTGSEVDFIFAGITSEDIPTDIDPVLQNISALPVSGAMDAVQGRIVRGDVTQESYDYSLFQQAASKICVGYSVRKVSTLRATGDERTFLGTEVHAAAIHYVMKSGLITDALHIPGPNLTTADEEFLTVPSMQESTEVARVHLDYTSTYISGGTLIVQGTYRILEDEGATLSLRLETSNGSTGSTSNHSEQEGSFTITVIDPLLPEPDFINVSAGIRLTLVRVNTDTFTSFAAVQPSASIELELPFIDANLTLRRRWRVSSAGSGGRLGYYASENEVYTNPPNYCGTDYWGSDCDGNTLLDTPVRYMRMPCRSAEPIVDAQGNLLLLGIEFTGVTYPHPDIVGHFFSINEYRPDSRTVQATGYMFPFNDQPDATGDKIEGRYLHYLPNAHDNERFSNSQHQNLVTPFSLIENRPARGEYIKFNNRYTSTYADSRPKYDKYLRDKTDVQLYGKLHTVGYTSTTLNEIRRIDRSIRIPYSATALEYTNRSKSANFNVVKLDQAPLSFDVGSANLNYVSVLTLRQPFTTLASVRYQFLHSEMEVSSTPAEVFTYYSGPGFISPLVLTNITRVTAADTSNTIFDILTYGLAELLSAKQINVEYEYIKGLYTESLYNLSRRPQGSEVCNQYFSEELHSAIDAYILRRFTEPYSVDGEYKYTLKQNLCSEWWGFNRDYGLIRPERITTHLPLFYDHCSVCKGTYLSRMDFTLPAGEELSNDPWRVFPPLNYVDLPANRGRIEAINYFGGYLIVRCQQAPFILQPDARSLQTEGGTIYLGTPEFLAIPASEAGSSDDIYGGQLSPLAQAVTPHGLCWYDEGSQQVFLYASSLTEISRQGMYTFFQAQAELDILYAFAVLSYDPRRDVLLIHRTAYGATSALTAALEDGSVTRVGNRFYFFGEVITEGDPLYFINHSFTLSYSFADQGWQSFHSYQPHGMFPSTRRLHTILEDGIYVHDNKTALATFYGRAYPVVVEGVISLEREAFLRGLRLQGVHYYARAVQYSQDEGSWVEVPDTTFDQGWAYTNQQSTGLFTVVANPTPYQRITWSAQIKDAVEQDRFWRLSGLRDIQAGGSPTSRSWTLRAPFYSNSQGYIDQVPAGANPLVPQVQQGLLRDRYAVVRLFFNSAEKRIVLHSIYFANLPALR